MTYVYGIFVCWLDRGRDLTLIMLEWRMERALRSYLQLEVGLIQKLLAQHGCILIDGSEEHSEKIRQYLHQGLVMMKWSYLHFIITMCTSLKVTFPWILAVVTETTFLADDGTI